MRKALLVVDVDHYDYWRPEDIASDPKKKLVAKAIKRTLDNERTKENVVIFVIGDWYGTGQDAQIRTARQSRAEPKDPKESDCIVCDRSDAERLAAFLEHRHETEAAFTKSYNDAFRNHKLAKYLRSVNIKEVMLAGCYTSMCIADTARGALQNGFHVTLLKNCIYYPFTNTSDKKEWLKRAKSAIPLGSPVRVKIA